MPEWLQALLYSPWLPIVLFLGAFGDAFILTSLVIFGEIFFVATGYAMASLEKYYFLPLIWLAAIIGDMISFYIGRRYGPSIVTKWVKKRAKWRLNFLRAKRLLRRRGITTVFTARLAGPISKFMPFIAGTLYMPSKYFIPASIAGVIVGSAQFIFAGWLIATGLQQREFLQQYLPLEPLLWVIGFSLLLIGCWYLYKNKQNGT